MSRLIVKNLPKQISEQKLREQFSSKGVITDFQLKYTKEGKFRKFAFIGYKTAEEAQAALDYFNNTFIYTARIQVEICRNLGEIRTPKPWEKKLLPEKKHSPEKKEKDKSDIAKNLIRDVVKEKLVEDSQFKDFLEVHQGGKSKPTWGDGNFDFLEPDFQLPSSESEDRKDETIVKKKLNNSQKTESSCTLVTDADASTEVQESPSKDVKKDKIFDDKFTVKIRNLPVKCKKSKLKKFLDPLKPQSLRIPPKLKGFAYASFKTEKEMNKALNKNKGFLEDHRISVVKYIKKVAALEEDTKKTVEEQKEENDELLAETGRIFIRNLYHNVSENDIKELFSKYGPLSEIHVPIDTVSKMCPGFAFVAYIFAEHAVKAFAELDGTIFMGRMLHLIPARAKKEKDIEPEDFGNDYKKKKAAKLKASSGSSHNWNILFLGMNAVADIISEKYKVDKSKLLSGESKESLAVRMALAETQVVIDTRKFLMDQGVELDAFSQPNAERSKTIIIVKNLPAKTASKDIFNLFSQYGTISKVILPASGMVALVEFQLPVEAKAAFQKLAYTRFRSLPLYLEWAPVNAIKPDFTPTGEPPEETPIEEHKEKEDVSEEEENYEDPEPNTTLFIKNINFKTTNEKLENHFKKYGAIHSAYIAIKKDLKSGKLLSMGYGFVQYKKRVSAVNAIQHLQSSYLDDHALEIKFSNQATVSSVAYHRKKSEGKKQDTNKILVRNIPFQASEDEVRDLFKEFGELKFMRLPKKMGGGEGEHRGFGFVEYLTKNNAKRAFETLCHSTHLYGRRLVLEWANTDSEDVDELRKKTAKDFYTPTTPSRLKKSKLYEDASLASAKKQRKE